MDDARLQNVICGAAAAGVSLLGFTGGEPFARFSSLVDAHRLAKSLGMRTAVATSAFWARSEEEAIERLSLLEGLDMLGISTDYFHQRFVPITMIRFAISAALKLDVPTVEVQISYLNLNEVELQRKQIGPVLDAVTLRGQRVWPVGRALPFSDVGALALMSISDLELSCPCMSTPTVLPNGDVVGCCSALIALGDRHPFILGDLNEMSVRELLEGSREKKYYQFVKTFGLDAIVDMILSGPVADLMEPGYVDVCHLCYDIHSKDQIRAFISHRIKESLGEDLS